MKNNLTLILFFLLAISAFAMPPAIITVSSVSPLCNGVDNGSITISATGTGPLTYSIDNGNNFQTSSIFTGLAPGTFDVVVQDGTGITTVQVILAYQQTITAAFTPSVISGTAILPVDFTNNSIGATSYNWNFDGSNANSTSVNPSFSYDMPGSFTVTLIASNNNCKDTATAVITVTGSSEITFVPNVFSPNDDGMNDVFTISSIGIQTMETFIYNRYGEIVYEWFGKNGQWDGHTYPAGRPAPDGTYFYFYKAVGFDGTVFEEKGTLTLLRNQR